MFAGISIIINYLLAYKLLACNKKYLNKSVRHISKKTVQQFVVMKCRGLYADTYFFSNGTLPKSYKIFRTNWQEQDFLAATNLAKKLKWVVCS